MQSDLITISNWVKSSKMSKRISRTLNNRKVRKDAVDEVIVETFDNLGFQQAVMVEFLTTFDFI